MGTPRYGPGVAALDGKIYAVGGINNDDDYLSSAEVFDLQTNAWTKLAPMRSRRKGFQLVAAQSKLYAVGGETSGGATLSSVEVYDPRQNCWEAAAPLPSPRVYHAVMGM